MSEQEMIELAKSIELPEWASHVAVSTARKEVTVEPCLWSDEAGGYLDGDPSGAANGAWVGGYNEKYWKFFSIEQLTKTN